jgi:hypothetical protein
LNFDFIFHNFRSFSQKNSKSSKAVLFICSFNVSLLFLQLRVPEAGDPNRQEAIKDNKKKRLASASVKTKETKKTKLEKKRLPFDSDQDGSSASLQSALDNLNHEPVPASSSGTNGSGSDIDCDDNGGCVDDGSKFDTYF